jgi:uncharacterized protein (DUF302 family)
MRMFFAVLAVVSSAGAYAADGLIEAKSAGSVKDTISKFEATAKERGLIIFARIDHAAGAQKIGATLRPTELLIFGNPQGGTPLMACAQSVGIDLPLKALAWEDASGQVWLGYNDPQWLVTRHGAKDCLPVAAKLRKALDALAAEAVR